MRNPTLTIPATLHPDHAAMLREHHFETAGVMRDLLRSDEYDGIRAIYAVTNPQQTALVYIGESEEGRDIRGRLKSHMNARNKVGHVEKESLVFVHVMVTEYMVLDRFEEVVGTLPVLNKRKVAKHQTRNWHVNGREALEEERAARAASQPARAVAPTPPKAPPGAKGKAPLATAKPAPAKVARAAPSAKRAPVKAPAKPAKRSR
jgi:hypothetical protein